MKFQLIALGLVLIVLWQVVGFGFTISFNQISSGQIAKSVERASTVRIQQSIEAQFSGSQLNPTYDSLVFVGDILLARNVEFLMRTKNLGYPFAGFKVSKQGVNPAIIGNFEASIPPEHKPTPVGQLQFSVPEFLIPTLGEAGFTHVSLANNHTYDFGPKAFSNTTAVISKQLLPFGHPKEVSPTEVSYLNVRDTIISLIGINGLETINEGELKTLFNTVNSKSDYQVVYIHWGEEYALRHNEQQSKMARKLVEAGADLIIGHHPHVVQGIDLIEGVPVFYSLGNYIFDQYFSQDVQEGLVISLTLKKNLQIDLLPVTSKYSLSQPNAMSPNEHHQFLGKLANKSHYDLREAILKGQIVLDMEIASSEKVAMMEFTTAYVQ